MTDPNNVSIQNNITARHVTKPLGDAMTITQLQAVANEILDFCDALLANGIPAGTTIDNVRPQADGIHLRINYLAPSGVTPVIPS